MTIEQPDSARFQIIELSKKFPSEARYPLILGDLYLRQDENAEALKYYQKAYEIDPDSPYYPVSMANYYEKMGQYDSAKLQINNALKNERLDFNTKLRILEYILQSSGQDFDSTNALFQTLLELHPDESQLKLIYGEYLTILQKFDEARFQIRLVTESEPENIDAWQQLLQLALQTEDFDEALRICNKCREIFPEEMIFAYYKGITYFQIKDYKSAITTFSDAIPLIPSENPNAISNFYSMLGDAYFKIRDTNKAFEAYESALKYNDKNTLALNNYAYYLSLFKKDLSKAERMSALCVKIEPNNSSYLDTYAWIFFMQGSLSLSKIYIEQALSKDRTNSAELADHYGDILFFLGDHEKAVEQWEKAWEKGKKTATIKRKIEEKKYFEATEDELFSDSDEGKSTN
jgi:tetratricopeptide (TPR) repeat protein